MATASEKKKKAAEESDEESTKVRLVCKLSHERGERVSVGNPPVNYDIDKDGFVVVDKEHADVMLQNPAKWAPAHAATPFKRPASSSLPLLYDRHGNELSEEETQKIVDKEKADAAALAKKNAPADDKKPKADDELPGEKPPAKWPEVTMDNKKDEMLDVLQRLAKGKHIAKDAFNDKMTKTDLLEVIEKGYDAIEEAGAGA